MESLEEMTNNQLQIEIKELEHAHEAQKANILAEVIKMEEIEKRYIRAKQLIIKRLQR
jgi:hypothetical protein